MTPFCQGEPGSMVSVRMPRLARPSRTVRAINSGPVVGADVLRRSGRERPAEAPAGPAAIEFFSARS
jgi:hypothetical protein